MRLTLRLKGGQGSGHHDHSGRPGSVGGSASGPDKGGAGGGGGFNYHTAKRIAKNIGTLQKDESGQYELIIKEGYSSDGCHSKTWPDPEYYASMSEFWEEVIEDLEDFAAMLEECPEDCWCRDIVEKQLPIGEESKRELMKLRQELFFDVSDDLAEKLYIGEISIGQWEETVKSEIRQLHTSMAAIGAGGWDVMDSTMWGRLGTPLREQYRYLHGFAEHIAENRETISVAMLKSRSRLYGKAGGYSVVLMQAGAIIEGQLPYMPKDGSTQCLIGCLCQWSLTKIGETAQGHKVQAVWLTNPAEHCEDCLEREGKMVIINVPFGMTIPDKIGGL